MSRRGRPGPRPGEQRVALVQQKGKFLVGELFFERGVQVNLDKQARRQVKPGELALVRVTPGRAQVVRGLGRPDSAAAVMEALMADRGLQRGFSRTVEREAADAVARGPAAGSRRDLTGLVTFTIDPAAAKDFDDAVSAEPEGDGLRVYVHIADVSAYVRPGTALDGEARRRAVSVYVPGRVEPMLPPVLSDEACSLRPGTDRPALTAELELTAAGAVASASFYRSTISSDVRLDYDQVERIFSGQERPPEAVAPALERARQAAAALRERREARGALAVQTTEPEFRFDADGEPESAVQVAQTEPHSLIEELMILTNEQVASTLERAGTGLLYRVHEQPEPPAIEFLVAQLASLEVPTPPLPEQMTPTQAGEMAGEISARVAEHVKRTGRGGAALSSLVLRSLKQAYYSPRNLGHAGLASPCYCHFTSPIRRYPDLVVHRALLGQVGADEAPQPKHELEEVGVECSLSEREAMKIERAADDVCLCFLLERELREEGHEQRFEGEVVGLIGAGAFVEFGGERAEGYEGFLPVRRLRGEYYELNEEQTALVGRRTGAALRLGDPVGVQVDRVERERGRVDLTPVEVGVPARG